MRNPFRVFEGEDVLIYDNRKCDPILWDISTPEKRDAAILDLFKTLDDWDAYVDLNPDDIPWDGQASDEHLWYAQAKLGNVAAAVYLLVKQQDYEYTSWTTAKLIDATKG